MLQGRYQERLSPSNEVIVISVARSWISGVISHAQPAWVEIKGGSAMSSPVVLITGALTGIGRATAFVLLSQGARVVVSGRHKQEGKKLEKELRQLGAEVGFVKTDVRHDDDIRALIDKTVARFGRLAIAVNNAGKEGQRGLR